MSLVCPKCDRTIKPGETVNLIGLDDELPDGRIYTDDELLAAHVRCPDPGPGLEDVDRRALVALWARHAQLTHQPRTHPSGLTCDEMGCVVCNAGDEFVGWAVEAFMRDGGDNPLGMPRPADSELLEAARECIEELEARL